MSSEFLLPDACSGLAAGCLFYPSAGRDTDLPYQSLCSRIRDFWFVDTSDDLRRQFTQAHELEDDRREIL
jgi:hypothetical protein